MSKRKGLSSCDRVRAALVEAGFATEIVTFAKDTRSSAQAAAAIGCQVEQIAKSLVFRAVNSDRPILVIASGANRVSEPKVSALLGEPIERASAAFVRERSGFAIGGVAPLGHKAKMTILIDQDLIGLAEIWAAAGAPNTVFRLLPTDLEKMTGGQIADVKETGQL